MSRTLTARRLLPVVGLALALTVAGCGSDSDKPSSSPTTPSSSSTGSADKAPKDLVMKVIKAGTGATVADGDSVTVDYQGTSWTDGKIFDQSYGKAPATFTTDGVVAGFGAALVGQKVGAQVIVSIPPKYAYGETGTSQSELAGQSLVFVVEIKATKAAKRTVTCNVDPGAASNAVKVTGPLGKTVKAKFKKPLTASKLQRTVTIKGKGAATKAGQRVDVVLTVFNARTGALIDAEPAQFMVGDKGLDKSFSAAVSCVKLGSRVVTALPAKDLFGKAGNAQAGIKPKDSIVLVTDVLSPSEQLTPAPWDDAPTVTFNGTEPPTMTLP